ncbi:hypothetical protein [Amycolatopsis sp. NPDC098790]|uniref:hypothetical protein n=1 Tax=Amycolatopsis sp. NPDC098790 TaxID=3363939 RepID=UPI0038038573
MNRIWRAFAASGLVFVFDAEIFGLALDHGIGLDGALAGAGTATFIGIEVVRRLFGMDDNGDGGPFLPATFPKPITG